MPPAEQAAPIVTVVVPTRERVDYLATCLRSVQVAMDEAGRAGWGVRVLVVDDASPTTATHEVAARLGAEYARVDEHDGQDNPAAAMAYGVARVKTPYLVLFGDDDVMLPRFLVSMLEAAELGYDLVTSAFVRTDESLRALETRVPVEPALGDLLAGVMMINDSALVRTDLMQAAPWDTSLGQDVLYPVWLSILIGGARATTVRDPGILYRRHGANISDRLTADDIAAREAIAEPFRAKIAAAGGQIPWSSLRLAELHAEALVENRRRDAEERAAAAARAKVAAWAALPLRTRAWRSLRSRARQHGAQNGTKASSPSATP